MKIDCYNNVAGRCYFLIFFFHGATARSSPGPPHYRGFNITLRQTTVGKTPLGE
jgi:hypothetical protein